MLGAIADVKLIAERKRVKRALITIANAPGQNIRRIAELCELLTEAGAEGLPISRGALATVCPNCVDYERLVREVNRDIY